MIATQGGTRAWLVRVLRAAVPQAEDLTIPDEQCKPQDLCGMIPGPVAAAGRAHPDPSFPAC